MVNFLAEFYLSVLSNLTVLHKTGKSSGVVNRICAYLILRIFAMFAVPKRFSMHGATERRETPSVNAGGPNYAP
jgi:hypothetical protein